MTALTAVERLPPDAKITVSALAASQPASKISMLPGQQWTFEDTLASLMMVSANDAAYATGREHVGQSSTRFAQGRGRRPRAATACATAPSPTPPASTTRSRSVAGRG